MSDLLRGVAPLTMARGITGSYLPPIYRNQMVRAGQLHPADLKRLTEWGYLVPAEKGDGHSAVAGAALPPVIGHDDEVFLVDHPSAQEPVLSTGPERSATLDREKAKADAEIAEKRAAAKAKLPTDGSAPDGRAGQAVWVEYLVARGSNYDDVKDVDKADLQKLAEQQKS